MNEKRHVTMWQQLMLIPWWRHGEPEPQVRKHAPPATSQHPARCYDHAAGTSPPHAGPHLPLGVEEVLVLHALCLAGRAHALQDDPAAGEPNVACMHRMQQAASALAADRAACTSYLPTHRLKCPCPPPAGCPMVRAIINDWQISAHGTPHAATAINRVLAARQRLCGQCAPPPTCVQVHCGPRLLPLSQQAEALLHADTGWQALGVQRQLARPHRPPGDGMHVGVVGVCSRRRRRLRRGLRRCQSGGCRSSSFAADLERLLDDGQLHGRLCRQRLWWCRLLISSCLLAGRRCCMLGSRPRRWCALHLG